VFTVVMLVVMMLSFGVFGATVFTKPTVAQVEEVGGLVHWHDLMNFVL